MLSATAIGQPASFVVQGDHKIGGFAVQRDRTLRGAIEEFGQPTRMRRDRTGWNGCIANWRQWGLQIFFYNLGGRDSCQPRYGYFRDATLVRQPWRTSRGLRIGHPARLIRRYHPRARRDPRASNWWWLVTRTFPFGDGGEYAALAAKVQQGRVVAFTVYHQSGGE
jgi:hypothetical protein